MPKAFGYCRLSKDETTIQCSACKMEWTLQITDAEQTEFDCPFCDKTFHWDKKDPISIQAQTDTCNHLFDTKIPREVTEMETLVDVNVSGEVPIRNRPKGQILFQKIRQGDYLIVAKLDRAFRDLEDCCRQLKFFSQLNIHLVVGEFPDLDLQSSMGKMCIQMLAMFAEFERQRISERTKIGLAKRKALGLPHGANAPRGYRLMCTKCENFYSPKESMKGQFCPICNVPRRGNTAHAPCPNEQRIMWRLLWERSGNCWKDWNTIAYDLNTDGIRTRKGLKITQRWCEKYFGDAVDLLTEGKLLLEYRPPKMENLTIHQIPNIPKSVAEKLEAKSRETPTKV